ncbi:hypothetical protein Hanom_Chr07g00606141 [Helianthus anomalus]
MFKLVQKTSISVKGSHQCCCTWSQDPTMLHTTHLKTNDPKISLFHHPNSLFEACIPLRFHSPPPTTTICRLHCLPDPPVPPDLPLHPDPTQTTNLRNLYSLSFPRSQLPHATNELFDSQPVFDNHKLNILLVLKRMPLYTYIHTHRYVCVCYNNIPAGEV